ncbi:hypothetical protein CsSME_00022421 [Camellia sinensis var. sinensis]
MATQTRSSLIFVPAILLFIITSTTTSQSQTQQHKSNFDLCAPFNCGNITFSFPFFPSSTFGTAQFYCGLPRFQIACDLSSSIPSIELSGRPYQVKQLFSSVRLVTVVDNQLIKDIRLGSCTSLQNITISITDGTVGNAVLRLPVGGVNLTIFERPNGNSLPTGFLDQVVGNYNCSRNRVYIWDGTRTHVKPGLGPVVETPVGCEYVSLPLSGAGLQRLRLNRSGDDAGGARTLLADVLSNGFQLEWPNITDCQICDLTGGRCGYDVSSQKIVCFCQGDCT